MTRAATVSPALVPYLERRTTDLPWLESIPSHWETARAKNVLVERVDKGHPEEPLLAATQNLGVVRKTHYGLRTVEATKDLHLLKLVEVGDFVISLRSFQGGIETAHHRGIISPAYTVLHTSDSAVRAYLSVLFKSQAFIQSLTLYVTGIREGQNIDWARLAVSEIPIPPRSECEAIARYCAHLDAKVNRLIRNKRRLIALLNEQKQVVAHEAITRGINASAPTEDSGVSWLGRIPAHWRVEKLSRLAAITGGMTPSMAERGYWDGDVPWVTPKDMKTLLLSDSKVRVTERAVQETGLRLLPVGAVLMVTRGMILARRVPVGRSIRPVTINQDMKALIAGADVVPDYLAYALLSAQSELSTLIDEAGHGTKRLPTERLRLMQLPVPPIEEQVAICRYVLAETDAIDAVVDRTTREIDLIREYRNRLVADVVTGQLDVRAAAASLPDLDPLDAAEPDAADLDMDMGEDEDSTGLDGLSDEDADAAD